jgi:hypothetical protein
MAYANFSKSPINRLAFVSNFVKVFEVEEAKAVWNGLDYLQLLRLVCSDFPRDLVLSALRSLVFKLDSAVQIGHLKMIKYSIITTHEHHLYELFICISSMPILFDILKNVTNPN